MEDCRRLANVAAVLLVAPFCEGVLRKVTACIQSRQGPPLRQPYFDLLKLLGKEDIESGESPACSGLLPTCRWRRFDAWPALCRWVSPPP